MTRTVKRQRHAEQTHKLFIAIDFNGISVIRPHFDLCFHAEHFPKHSTHHSQTERRPSQTYQQTFS